MRKTKTNKKEKSFHLGFKCVKWPKMHLRCELLPFSVAESPPGVFLYLGYSKKDSIILTRGRMKIQDEKNIPR